MTKEAAIVIIDMGSQYTRVIERRLREAGYRSAVLSPARAELWLTQHDVLGIIISGGDKSVYDEDAPQVPEAVLKAGVPILGICYGMQWLARHFGGEVEHQLAHVGFGPAHVAITPCELFASLAETEPVWASHGDSVVSLPPGATCIATDTDGAGIKAMHLPEKNVWGVQFHPEVEQTTGGGAMLVNFVKLCGCKPDWSPADLAGDIRANFRDESIRAIHGFSGGVDSTVAAALLAPELGERLHSICVDGGHLRAEELAEIRAHAKAAGVDLTVIEAEDRFFAALAGITDAEAKRAAFKEVYNTIFLEEAAKCNATHVVQGTLATDLIESGATGGAVIKSHHNVGLDWGDLTDLHPLSSLFKYEVRALASELKLPKTVTDREPFPGPGLFLRMPGAVDRERRDLIRFADEQVRSIVYSHADCPEISQLVTYLSGTKIVGVKGDARVYEEMVVVRPVKTIDFMTASAPIFSEALMTELITELTRHPKIVGVLFDFNPKPPRTTEAE